MDFTGYKSFCTEHMRCTLTSRSLESKAERKNLNTSNDTKFDMEGLTIYKLLVATLVALVIPELLMARPSDQTETADHDKQQIANTSLEIVTMANLTTFRAPVKRARRRINGIQQLSDLCPNWQSKRRSARSHPCIRATFTCYGHVERVCETTHGACLSATPTYGHPKCEPDHKLITVTVNGKQKRVVQTLTCRCAS